MCEEITQGDAHPPLVHYYCDAALLRPVSTLAGDFSITPTIFIRNTSERIHDSDDNGLSFVERRALAV